MALTCVVFFLLFFLSFACILGLNDSKIKIPAVHAFGDSGIDAGNNQYIPNARAKFNFRPYGIDFLGGLPTGRATNGKTVVDFIAESAGLPLPPPMLSLSKAQLKSTLTGVNYASSASGIQSMPHKTAKLFVKVLSMKDQIKLFKKTTRSIKHGFESTESFALHLSKSLFFINTGTNDIGVYWELDLSPSFYNVEDYASNVSKMFHKHLTNLYRLGARRFLVNNVSPLGCRPSYRHRIPHNISCVEDVNRRVATFNDLFPKVLTKLEKSLKGSTFILCDLYKLFEEVHAQPQTYGFTNVVDSCCIDVNGNQTRECAPGRTPCIDRGTHAFFDPFHSSQSMHKLWFQRCVKNII